MVVNTFRPDLDDKVLHVVLVFSGMFLFAVLKKLADVLGVDVVNWIKAKIRRKSGSGS